MKLLNTSFLVISKEESAFLKYRHSIDSTIFSAFKENERVLHVKLYDGTFEPDPNKEEVFFKARPGFFRLPFSMCRFIQRQKRDVILLHGFLFPVQVLLLRFLIGNKTKLILQHHAEKPFKNKFKRWLQRMAYSRLNAYLFASAQLAEVYLEEKIVTDASKIHEVMEGSTLFTRQDRNLSRTKLGMDPGTVFLWVGRLNANKDPLTVLKAMVQYKQAGKKFRLYMIYGDAELETEVKTFVSAHHLQQEVLFIGNVQHEELEAWFSAADYFISASHYEGSGIALCEAMACGCVPIVTRISSFINMTDQGKCAYLYETSDSEGLLRILLSLDPSQQDADSQKVVEKFKKDLSLEAIGRRIEEIASDLIAI